MRARHVTYRSRGFCTMVVSGPASPHTIEPAAPCSQRSRPEHGGCGVGAGLACQRAGSIVTSPKSCPGAADRRAHRGLVIRSSFPPTCASSPPLSVHYCRRYTRHERPARLAHGHQRSGDASCRLHGSTGRLRSAAVASAAKRLRACRWLRTCSVRCSRVRFAHYHP